MTSPIPALQAAFLADILENPLDATPWLVGSDAREDATNCEDAICAAMRSVGAALQGVMPAEPLRLLPGLRQMFDIGHSELGHACYLQIAGFLTQNRLTSLQGDLMLDYLQNDSIDRDHLLQQIWQEIHLLPGLETITNENLTVSSYKGTVDFKLSGSNIFTLPPGFHVSGNADLRRCYSLTSISNGFYAGGNAEFRFCDSLTSTGDGFHAGGDVIFQDCEELGSPGNGFYAGSDVYFWDCRAISGFPADITIKGRICDLPATFPSEALDPNRYPNLSHVAKESLRTELATRNRNAGHGAP